jgi:hypothetical protein
LKPSILPSVAAFDIPHLSHLYNRGVMPDGVEVDEAGFRNVTPQSHICLDLSIKTADEDYPKLRQPTTR